MIWIQNKNSVIKLSQNHQEKLANIYFIAKKSIRESRPYAEEVLLLETFLSLIQEILKRPAESCMMLLTRKRRLLNRFLEYGRENSTANITVSSLSREIGVSPRRIQQLFQDEIGGLTPKSYLRSQRLYSAYRMLRNTPPVAGAVSSVAAELEFNNFSKFTQSYQRLFGELPSATLRRPD